MSARAITLVTHRTWPDEIAPLIELGRAEGYRFVDRLVDEWRSGELRFDGPGEVFLTILDVRGPRGFGGLAVDRYAGDARVGRLQHVFVDPSARGSGLGSRLVGELVAHARAHFDRIRLRTSHAGRFYEKLGFAAVHEADTTHVLTLAR